MRCALDKPLYYDDIAFVSVLLPYCTNLSIEFQDYLASELNEKLVYNLLKTLSSIATNLLQEELTNYLDSSNNDYENFVFEINIKLPIDYPVLHQILLQTASNYNWYINTIVTHFKKDYQKIISMLKCELNEKLIISNIDTDLGDSHQNGSTALITFSNNRKLIYKPQDCSITIAYNKLIEWVNEKSSMPLETMNCIEGVSYGWLEFIPYTPIEYIDHFNSYYYRAGMLLAITLALGSKDCHYENLIASGQNPILIDHETLLQPVLSDINLKTWEDHNKIPVYSVLESSLIVHKNSNMPEHLAGFGTKGQIESIGYQKETKFPNSIQSKNDIRLTSISLIKNNVPKLDNNPIFANDFKNKFKDGFSDTYELFLKNKEELLGENSVLKYFENIQIRYVWRPTNIYHKIQNYLYTSKFLNSFKSFESKLNDLLAKAYKDDNHKPYLKLLKQEVEEMTTGNIPMFTINSSETNLTQIPSFKMFSQNAIQNFKNRIAQLNTTHKNEQLKLIDECII